MASLRPCVAVLCASILCLCAQSAPAFAAHRHARHATACSRAAHPHGRAGSVRFSHRATPRRRRCPVHHSVRRSWHPTRPAPIVAPAGRSRSSAADAACTGADLRPSRQNTELIRTATLCLVNRERSVRGEPELHSNPRLEAAARSHTESMAFGDYFEHLGPGGQTPVDRMRASGYIYSSRIGFEVGENIAWGTGYLSTPRSIVAGWMASPGHRAIILDARFRDTAVGVSPHPPNSLAHGQAGGIYTQDFGVISGG